MPESGHVLRWRFTCFDVDIKKTAFHNDKNSQHAVFEVYMKAAQQQKHPSPVAIVTGGGSGIGRALCHAFSREGITTIIMGRTKNKIIAVARKIEETGGMTEAVQTDVSNERDFTKAINDIYKKYGRLDYMVNNAGVAIAGEFRDLKLEHFKTVLSTNLMGTLYGTQCAYEIMRKQGYGNIVNMSSITGLVGLPTSTAYVMSKSGIVGFTVSLWRECRGSDIHVSVVCPGKIDTPIWDSIELVNVKEKNPHFRPIFPKPITSEDAARYIIKGLRKKKPIIVFPLSAKMIWWLYRYIPVIMNPVGDKIVKDFRKIRNNTEQ